MTARTRRGLAAALTAALGLSVGVAPLAAQPAPAPARPAPAEAAAPAPAPVDVGRRLSLAEALDLGLAESPDLAIGAKSVDAARAHLRATRAQRLPTVKVEANVLRWDEELAFEVAPGVPPLVAREQITSSVGVTAALPLTNQLTFRQLVRADEQAVTAARREQSAASESLASGIAQVYLGVLLARAQVDISSSRVQAVESQLTRARALAEGGVLKRVDVLRLEAALAAARREVIEAQAGVASAAEQLGLLLGLPPGDRVDAVDDLAADPKPPPIDAAAAEQGALDRPALAVADARAAQARAGVGAAKTALIPSVAAIGNYSHQEGAGPFQPEDSWYVGLVASWDVWDWGRNYRLYQEADHRAEQARMVAARERDRARIAARKQVRDARAAYEALAVARAGLAAAEEAYRIEAVRYAEGDTTTTDLLQAETEQAQARLAVAAARHAYYVQLAALAEATGQRPDAVFTQVR